MATTHTTASRNAMAEAIRTLANGGSGSTTITVHDSGDTELVSIDIPDFGAASSGVITSAGSGNSGTAGATGTASYARVNDGDGTEVFRGAVGTSGTEFIINSTSITSGGNVALTANPTWTAPT
jgi:hypothetical protein